MYLTKYIKIKYGKIIWVLKKKKKKGYFNYFNVNISLCATLVDLILDIFRIFQINHKWLFLNFDNAKSCEILILKPKYNFFTCTNAINIHINI